MRGAAARIAVTVAVTLLIAMAASGPASALDKIRFGIDWKAEAEYGGYYQAKATGLYAKHGLDVEIRQGGPQVNHPQLLAAGVLDFAISSNTSVALNFVAHDIPMVTVAAFFQKDPAVLISHAEAHIKGFADMKGKPILISSDTREGWWLFLKAKFGLKDSQIRPYTFQMAPFLADKSAIQQGYVTSEPYTLEKAGAKVDVHLIADAGWPSYGNLVTTSARLIKQNPDLVQRFVDATIEGWYSYLYGDPSPANALIKKENPEMTDDLIANGIAKMKQYGIVDSGDARKDGIGALNPARIAAFFKIMADAGIYPKDMDWRKGFDFGFVNKKLGMRTGK
ncbi:MAG TPA: ABC transporter substrate-binding protein [Alphaproteobacteria bacterium]|nr:ABC transporter substrate-binding protein [Alphaproteobacteria bacterium]